MENQKPPRISVIGDIFCDVLAGPVRDMPVWGADALASIRLLPGGSGLNTVLHGANYAAAVSQQQRHDSRRTGSAAVFRYFSSIGDDAQGELLQRAVDNAPLVENHLSKRIGQRTPTCIVLSGPADRAFVSDRGCIDVMQLDWFDMVKLLDCDHIHVAGFFNCTSMRHQVKQLFELVTLLFSDDNAVFASICGAD